MQTQLTIAPVMTLYFDECPVQPGEVLTVDMLLGDLIGWTENATEYTGQFPQIGAADLPAIQAELQAHQTK